MKKKKKNQNDLFLLNAKDTNGLFSGKYKTQVFKNKKDILKIQENKQKRKGYIDDN